MTYSIRKSYTSTIPIMMGVVLNSYSLLSGTTSSTIQIQSDPSDNIFIEKITDENTFARIEDYVKDNYNIKGDFKNQTNLSSDLFFFNLTQNFIEDQINLDEEFMDALNSVTSKIGKSQPTKSRF